MLQKPLICSVERSFSKLSSFVNSLSKVAGKGHAGSTSSANSQAFQGEDCHPLEDSDLKHWCSGQSHSILCLL